MCACVSELLMRVAGHQEYVHIIAEPPNKGHVDYWDHEIILYTKLSSI